MPDPAEYTIVTPRRRLVATALAVALLLALAASSAQAYTIHGSAWPGRTITYYSYAYRTAVDRAAHNWNNAKVGVQFKRVSSPSGARVIVKLGANPCEGFSIVGYYRGQSWVKLGANCSRDLMTLVATHEFGHTLGLGHENARCARMNPIIDYDGNPNLCQWHPISYWLAHPLRGDDIKGARALYTAGFRSSRVRAPKVLP